MVEEHHIRVKRTLRYYTAGNPDAGKKLFALHGYSQHPKYFLRKIASLGGQDLELIAPEGLHRFYIHGHSGRVGASWMTKEDRENDIADNIAYLDQLVDELAARPIPMPREATDERILMGFSQGTATAVRYFCATQHAFDKLILWAGSFPPDLSLPDNRDKLNTVGIDLVVGDEDEFIHSEHILELKSLFDHEGISYRIHRFRGGHDLDLNTLQALL